MNQRNTATDVGVDKNTWNYHPPVPISTGGIFNHLTSPLEIISGILVSWFGLYVRGIFLLVIATLWIFAFPSMDNIGGESMWWVLQIYLINNLLMLCWAGSLHLYLYTFARQGRFLHFDMNAMQKGKKFTFGDQVYDNIFWTLAWGVPIWTIYECGLLWLLAHGFIPSHSWQDGAVWFVALFVIIPFVDSAHFYFIHRFLHIKWVHKHIHSIHHRNLNVGPWSGLSMHPVESAIYLSPVAIHLFLPSDPLHIVFHISWYAMGPATTHCGFEAIKIGDKKYPRLGDFFHVLHHKYYQCNYGNSGVPLDRYFGSFHDGTAAATNAMRDRIRALLHS